MDPKFRPYTPWPSSDGDARALFENFETALQTRRSLRMFSKARIPKETIERLITLAASAPSGANKQPWHFVAVENPDVKMKIRTAAEEEEKSLLWWTCHGRMARRPQAFCYRLGKTFSGRCALAHCGFSQEL